MAKANVLCVLGGYAIRHGDDVLMPANAVSYEV